MCFPVNTQLLYTQHSLTGLKGTFSFIQVGHQTKDHNYVVSSDARTFSGEMEIYVVEVKYPTLSRVTDLVFLVWFS